MASIIGRTGLIKHLRYTAPKSRATGEYRARNERLPELGYASYSEYLKSPEWAVIRRDVLNDHPTCCVCDRTACQVHHWDYHDAVMMGLDTAFLLPVCDGCHGEIEFDGKRKRNLKECQSVLIRRIKKQYAIQITQAQSKRNAAEKKKRKQNRPAKVKHRTRHRICTGLRCDIMRPGSTEWRPHVVAEPMDIVEKSVTECGRCWTVAVPDGSTLRIDIKAGKKSGLLRKY
jgi:hypothetical protein